MTLSGCRSIVGYDGLMGVFNGSKARGTQLRRPKGEGFLYILTTGRARIDTTFTCRGGCLILG